MNLLTLLAPGVGMGGGGETATIVVRPMATEAMMAFSPGVEGVQAFSGGIDTNNLGVAALAFSPGIEAVRDT